MDQYTNQYWQQPQIPNSQPVIEPNPEEESRFGDTLLDILSYLLLVPLYILAVRIIPDADWIWNLDRILLFFGLLFVIQLLIEMFRTPVLIAAIVGLLFLSYNSFINKNPYSYGWMSAFYDYKELVYVTLNKDIKPERLVQSTVYKLKGVEIQKAVEYNNESVKRFAKECFDSNEAFRNCAERYPKYETLIRSFAIFDVIYENWDYEPDPEYMDTPARASVTVNTFKGDCEDHAILMSAAIKSIGGDVRIVLMDGHAYPEINIGNRIDYQNVEDIVKEKLFPNARGRVLYCHIEEDGYWLNLDYTESYPGGHFMGRNDEKITIVNI